MEYIRLQNNQDLPDITAFKPFKCLVIIEEDVSNSWRIQASDWLVESGCVYMLAWGKECSIRDDVVDEICIEKEMALNDGTEVFVITTWHDDEPLEEYFHFCKYHALEDEHENEIKNTVILHISDRDKEAEFRKLMEQV